MKEKCPYCKNEFDEEEVEKHKFECASSYQDLSFNFENKIPCEICKELIDFDKYSEHISLCSQPTGSFPFLMGRLNSTNSNLLRILNIPIPPNTNSNTINNDNSELATNEGANDIELNNGENNLPINNQSEVNNINDTEEDENYNLANENLNTMEYNINLINYNMNLINNLLRHSQFRNDYIGDTYESLSVLDENVVKEGLKVENVSQIVVLEEKTKCPICLEDFDSGEKFRMVKCNHNFCDECLSDWLEENKKCPVCMIEIE